MGPLAVMDPAATAGKRIRLSLPAMEAVLDRVTEWALHEPRRQQETRYIGGPPKLGQRLNAPPKF